MIIKLVDYNGCKPEDLPKVTHHQECEIFAVAEKLGISAVEVVLNVSLAKAMEKTELSYLVPIDMRHFFRREEFE